MATLVAPRQPPQPPPCVAAALAGPDPQQLQLQRAFLQQYSAEEQIVGSWDLGPEGPWGLLVLGRDPGACWGCGQRRGPAWPWSWARVPPPKAPPTPTPVSPLQVKMSDVVAVVSDILAAQAFLHAMQRGVPDALAAQLRSVEADARARLQASGLLAPPAPAPAGNDGGARDQVGGWVGARLSELGARLPELGAARPQGPAGSRPGGAAAALTPCHYPPTPRNPATPLPPLTHPSKRTVPTAAYRPFTPPCHRRWLEW